VGRDKDENPSVGSMSPHLYKERKGGPATGFVLVGGGSPGYFGTTSAGCPPPTNLPFACAGQLTVLYLFPFSY
jgi:hypothetical protein